MAVSVRTGHSWLGFRGTPVQRAKRDAAELIAGGSRGAQASLWVGPVDGAQTHDGGGGQEGPHKRPVCLSTLAA